MASGAKQLLGGLFAAVSLALVMSLLLAPVAGAATFSAHGSVRQVWAVGARPGERLALLNPRGRVVAVRVAGPLGGVVFRGVAAGRGYRVAVRAAADTSVRGSVSARLPVLPDRSAPPSTAIYRQRIPRS